MSTAEHEKALSTLRARFARFGWGLVEAHDEHGATELIAHRWAHSRVLPDTAAAEQLLAVLAGQCLRGPIP